MTLFLGISQSSAEDQLAFRSTSFCNDKDVVHQKLISEFEEVPIAQGNGLIFSEGLEGFAPGVLTFYANPDTLDFSVVMTFPDNISCILVSGKNFKPFIEEDAI